MKKREWLLRLQRPLLAAVCTMPITLMLSIFYMPQAPLLWYAAPAMYLLLSCLCLIPHGQARLWCGVAAAFVQVIALIGLLPWQAAWQLLFLPLGYTVLLMVLLPMGGLPADHELHPLLPIAALVAYIFAQFMVSRVPQTWGPIGTPLTICFLLYLLLTMLMLNRLSLANAMVDGVHRPPAALKRRNTLLIAGMFAAAVLLSLAPVIADLLNRLWQLIRNFISFLVHLLPVPETSSGSPPPGDASAMFGVVEATEPSLFAIIMERIMMAIAAVIAVVLIILLIRAIVKVVMRLVRYISDRFRSLAAAASEDYVDESIDTRDGDDQTQANLLELLSRLRPLSLSSLAPRERIRYVYARMRRSHSKWSDHQTARETLPDPAALLYEKARYSLHDVTADDAAAFSEQTKRL